VNEDDLALLAELGDDRRQVAGHEREVALAEGDSVRLAGRHTVSGANTFVAGIIDIEALRHFRVMNLNSNWMRDLRTEIFRRIYEEPIHPANLWLDPHAAAPSCSTRYGSMSPQAISGLSAWLAGPSWTL
jgi:hypothetical protein